MKAARDERAARAGWAAMACGALLGAFGASVAFAPAHWLAAAVARASAGHLQLHDPRGTVWSGSALLMLTGGPGSTDRATLPGRLRWELGLARAARGDAPGSAAWAHAQLRLHLPCCAAQPITLSLVPGIASARVSIAPGGLNLPAGWLAGLGTPFNTLQLGGSLQARTPGMQLAMAQGRIRIDGQAELVVANAVSSLSTVRPLGTYRVELTGGDAPRMQLSTLDGALQLQGSGQFVGARLRFSGVASAAPAYESALGNLLNIIGRRDGGRSIISTS